MNADAPVQEVRECPSFERIGIIGSYKHSTCFVEAIRREAEKEPLVIQEEIPVEAVLNDPKRFYLRSKVRGLVKAGREGRRERRKLERQNRKY